MRTDRPAAAKAHRFSGKRVTASGERVVRTGERVTASGERVMAITPHN
jgi:hypothetical protein